jgi:hypothetical protein
MVRKMVRFPSKYRHLVKKIIQEFMPANKGDTVVSPELLIVCLHRIPQSLQYSVCNDVALR